MPRAGAARRRIGLAYRSDPWRAAGFLDGHGVARHRRSVVPAGVPLSAVLSASARPGQKCARPSAPRRRRARSGNASHPPGLPRSRSVPAPRADAIDRSPCPPRSAHRCRRHPPAPRRRWADRRAPLRSGRRSVRSQALPVAARAPAPHGPRRRRSWRGAFRGLPAGRAASAPTPADRRAPAGLHLGWASRLRAAGAGRALRAAAVRPCLRPAPRRSRDCCSRRA